MGEVFIEVMKMLEFGVKEYEVEVCIMGSFIW